MTPLKWVSDSGRILQLLCLLLAAIVLVACEEVTFEQTVTANDQDRKIQYLASFPGAEGAGATTPGGRGGKVIEVTNLEDGGPGSLRAAIDTPGPRIVVFRVGGTIELQNPLRIRHPFLTVAGQTAPGGGITLKGSEAGGGKMIVIRDTHDIVLRYLRIRSGAHGEPGKGQINVMIDSGAYNIVIDHCSLSWTLDENLSIHRNIPDDADPETWPTIQNVTVQNTILAEGLSPHSTGMQLGGEAAVEGWRGVNHINVHRNLFVSNSHRNPGVGTSNTAIINNVVYNWSPRVGSTWRNIRVDWIGNYFKAGPMSTPNSWLVHNHFPKGMPFQPWPAPSLYVEGNVAPPSIDDPEDDNWPMLRIHYSEQPLPASFRRHRPLPQPLIPVTIQSALDAYETVLADVGANARLNCEGEWVSNSDAVDQRLLSNVREGTGPEEAPPFTPEEVGGYAEISGGEACDDEDGDGMPDIWERARGLDTQADDSAAKTLDAHYTNIEVYLNGG